LGAYGAALAAKAEWGFAASLLSGVSLAAFAAIVFGWFCVRLSGTYMAMLTLAFAQIVWSIVFQWDAVTGGSNGIVGVWPPEVFSNRDYFYWLTLLLCGAFKRATFAVGGLCNRGRASGRGWRGVCVFEGQHFS
jgi:branched-chain amino acid transport system permease protein